MTLIKYILLLSLLLQACNSPTSTFVEDSYSITLDGNKLSQDANGYYLLPLSRNTYQTIHRVTGELRSLTGDTVMQEQLIHFESSHYWWFAPGDTVITIYRRNVNDQGQWVIIDTATVVATDSMIVPTTNATSYTDNRGNFSDVIAPTIDMLGDTLTLQARWYSEWYPSDTVTTYIRFILQ